MATTATPLPGAPPAHDHAWAAQGYSTSLTNDDSAPTREADLENLGHLLRCGCPTCTASAATSSPAGLFVLGLTGWQVLLCADRRHLVVLLLINLVAKPSQRSGVPYPVICRASRSAWSAPTSPAIIRGRHRIAWYGIQTYLASAAVDVAAGRVCPGLKRSATHQLGFLGLSHARLVRLRCMWLLQLVVFYRGMETIRKFIDFCGPAVYVVMFVLRSGSSSKAGWGSLS